MTSPEWWGFALLVSLSFTLVFVIGQKLNNLEERINGLAKGQATQGTREQERVSPSAVRSEAEDSLPGHWHKEYENKHVNLYLPALKAEYSCLAFHQGEGLTCTNRDPRSTT